MGVFDKVKGLFGKKKEEEQAQAPAPQPEPQPEPPKPEPPKEVKPSAAEISSRNTQSAKKLAADIDQIRSLLGTEYLKQCDEASVGTVEGCLARVQDRLSEVHEVVQDQSELDASIGDILTAVKSVMEKLQGSVEQLEGVLQQLETVADWRFRADKADQVPYKARIAHAQASILLEQLYEADTRAQLEETTKEFQEANAAGKDFSVTGAISARGQQLQESINGFNQRIAQYRSTIGESEMQLTRIVTVPDPARRNQLIEESRAKHEEMMRALAREREEHQKRYFEQMAEWERTKKRFKEAQVVVASNAEKEFANAINNAAQQNAAAATAANEAPVEEEENEPLQQNLN